MKSLFINRHAKSSWKDLKIRDFDRPLNKRGKINARFMATKFAENTTVDLIISSPAKRALTTAREFAEALNLDKVVENRGIYGAGIREMLNIINSIPPEVEKAMLFGHNPTFSDLAHHLDHDFHSHLVTCARVRIDFDVDNWDMIGLDSGTVVSHYYPRMYPEMENL